MKKSLLIINADDFGLSPGVNEGIEQAHRRGAVTSASLMVNVPAFAGAIDILRRNPALSVGIHLNLSVGPPVAGEPFPAPAREQGEREPERRTGETGWFQRPFLQLSRLPLDWVEREWRAQILRFLAPGLQPTHLDSHHHVHLHPRLFPIALDLCAAFSIPALRVVPPRCVPWEEMDEALNPAAILSPEGLGETWQMACDREGKPGAPRFCRGGVYGFPSAGDNLERRLRATLQNLGEETAEFFCHPAIPDSELSRFSRFIEGRWDELTTLLSPETGDLLTRVQLLNYREALSSL
ncbi:ChbG/HpnK family deacetylase [Heliobacterium gestii]|uniref:ChbG/HpnK family deacetylase n=1 Tax=Heliomicrobium gestii TaxID=2699 RepID=A0A845LB60_HELGE|nr:ChbG/HpnK family deacetylase [Heliomicrobium gestii]MBM7866139.1 putative glycoside hydrolase/deacetylase ChbG (UPF0249 family) [Heliomicrobium gestii]MZP42534.1 ChbG/HpnK family deacetylase [Heliomicrobium gestii]